MPRVRILRGEPCPRCEHELCQPTGGALEVVRDLGARWRRRRWLYYGALTAGTLLTGWVPLLAAPVRFLGLVAPGIRLWTAAVAERARSVQRLSESRR